MTYKDLMDAVREQVKIDAQLRGLSQINLSPKLVFLWISQAEKYINRRFRVLRADATVTLTNGVGDLPKNYDEMISVEGGDYKLVEWDKISDYSSYAYTVNGRQIKVAGDVDEVNIHYLKEIGTTLDNNDLTDNPFHLTWDELTCEEYSGLDSSTWDEDNPADAWCVELKLPTYQKATEYLVLSNVFKEYKQLAEAELVNIGYKEEKPEQIEGSLGY